MYKKIEKKKKKKGVFYLYVFRTHHLFIPNSIFIFGTYQQTMFMNKPSSMWVSERGLLVRGVVLSLLSAQFLSGSQTEAAWLPGVCCTKLVVDSIVLILKSHRWFVQECIIFSFLSWAVRLSEISKGLWPCCSTHSEGEDGIMYAMWHFNQTLSHTHQIISIYIIHTPVEGWALLPHFCNMESMITV